MGSSAISKYALALCFAAAGAAPALAEATTLKVLYSNAYVNKESIEELVQQFEARNTGVDIKLDIVKNYTEMTQLMLRASMTGDVPDVGFQGLSFVRLFAERGLAVPLQPFIAKENDWQQRGYSQSVMGMAKKGDETFGIPYQVSVPIVYFNLDLVRRAGGNPHSLPTTWQGITDLAKKIDAPSGGIFFDYTPTANWTFIALVQSLGGQMMTPDEKQVAFNGAEGLEAFKILKDIGHSGMRDMTRDQAKQAFAAGSLGVFVTSSSDITLYTKQAAGQFEIRVAPFPSKQPGGVLPAGGNALMIHTKDPEKQKVAWDFIKFFTGADAQTLMAKSTAYIPVNTLAISDPARLGDYYKGEPNLKVAVSQLPIMTSWFSFPGENSLKITPVIEDAMRKVLFQQAEPQDALEQIAKAVQGLM